MSDGEELEQLIYKVFERTEDGKKLLEKLTEIYLLKSSCCAFGSDTWWPYYRDGQNQVIRDFRKAIERVKLKLKGD